MTNKRITLTAGDYIRLSDIPNKQVFNLVKKCFINAGFNDCNGKYAQWDNAEDYKNLGAGLSEYNLDLVEFTNGVYKRQLSLSDIFNSVNGGWCWNDFGYIHVYDDHILYGDTKYPSNPLTLVSIKRITDSPEAIIQPEVSQWWDYDKGCAVGLPPVDTECEYSLNEGKFWWKCKVISQHKLVLHCPNLEDNDWNGLQVINRDEVIFRPLDYKTPKQVAVDKALDIMHDISGATYCRLAEALYDAGMLKVAE